jgi:hypothetical protein
MTTADILTEIGSDSDFAWLVERVSRDAPVDGCLQRRGGTLSTARSGGMVESRAMVKRAGRSVASVLATPESIARGCRGDVGVLLTMRWFAISGRMGSLSLA